MHRARPPYTCVHPALHLHGSWQPGPGPAPAQALSVNLRQQTLDAAGRNIGRLRAAIERVKATDADRLRQEYSRLVTGLQAQGTLEQPSRSPLPSDDTLANPALPDDILREAVSAVALLPANGLRKARQGEHLELLVPLALQLLCCRASESCQ